MSLDVYLKGPPSTGITRCRCCGHESEEDASEYYYEANITHNLNAMAEAAGIYQHLWRPEEIGIDHAEQLVEPLTAGLKLLRDYPDKFKAFNPANGWGNYDNLVSFVRKYLAACREHPEAKVSVSR